MNPDLKEYVDDVIDKFDQRLAQVNEDMNKLRTELGSASGRVDALENDVQRIREDWFLAQAELVALLRTGKVA